MGLFTPQSVKALKKEAELIGNLHGQAFLGHISQADVADVVGHEDFRARLRLAFDEAAVEVGEQKALKAAASAAKSARRRTPG